MLAAEWGISAEIIIGFIKRGELLAIDISANRGGRPRFLIDEKDIADFEQRRRVVTETPVTPRRKLAEDIHVYF